MNTKNAAKMYSLLTPRERLPLIMAAVLRKDEPERLRLMESAPNVHWSAELAAALGITTAALDALSPGWCNVDDLRTLRAGGAGWAENPPEGAYAFAERAGDGRLVGFSLRALDGRKGSPSRAIGARRGLVIAPNLHGAPGPILIVEGASDVAAALTVGLVAVGRPTNAGGADDLARLLKGRNVIVVGENDAKPTGAWPGRDGAERVAVRLATAWQTSVRWALLPQEAKDVRAWLAVRVAAGLDMADGDACRAAGVELLSALQSAAEPAEPEKAPSMAERLVRLAQELYRLGRTDRDEPFAVPNSGPNVALLFRGGRDALRATLAREFRRRTGKTPNAAALTDALTALAGEALDTEPEAVALRVAPHDGGIVIDLADADGRAVIVRPTGWEVVEASPVLFRRTALNSVLPVPERGGTLDELRDLLNVGDDAWPLLAGWLIAALLPDLPHPILLLSGTQGTGKSTAARILVGLFDPSNAPLRSEPRDAEQWAITAAGSWGVALDNLSSIPPWLSDALCKAVTGDGWVRRALYTDSDLSVLAFRRVVLLTSIDAGALRGDLGERLLLADLDPIPPTARRTEAELDRVFAERRPRLLGAILDALVTVLAGLPAVQLDSMPRMADFGRVLAALDATGIVGGCALDTYLAQGGRVAAEVIDGDLFAMAVLKLADDGANWSGTAGDLADALRPEKPPRGWPATGPAVRGRLKRLVPALATQGVIVRFPAPRTRRGRLIEIESVRDKQSQVSPHSPEPISPDNNLPPTRECSGDGPAPTAETALPTVTPKPPESFGESGPDDCGDCCDGPPPQLSAGTDRDEWGAV